MQERKGAALFLFVNRFQAFYKLATLRMPWPVGGSAKLDARNIVLFFNGKKVK
jgi:hypothetical protein